MLFLLSHVNSFLSNPFVLIVAILSLLLVKFFLLIACIRYFGVKFSQRILLTLFIIFLTAAIFDDCWYFLSVIRSIYELKGDFCYLTLLARIDWLMFISQYQALALSFEYLIERGIRFKLTFVPHVIMNAVITLSFLYLAIFKFNIPASSSETLQFERLLTQIAYIYLPFLFIPLFYKVIRLINRDELPPHSQHSAQVPPVFFCAISYP